MSNFKKTQQNVRQILKELGFDREHQTEMGNNPRLGFALIDGWHRTITENKITVVDIRVYIENVAKHNRLVTAVNLVYTIKNDVKIGDGWTTEQSIFESDLIFNLRKRPLKKEIMHWLKSQSLALTY